MRICESYACRPCQELEDTERQLSDAIRVGHLRRTITSLKSDVNAAHDRVISRLPIELISRVFCMPDDEPQPLDQNLGDSTPWISCFPQHLLGSVSIQWWDIAWSTPQIWNVIRLRLHPDTLQLGGLLAPQLQVVAAHLLRSGAFPLSIRMQWHPNHGGMYNNANIFQSIIDLLNSSSDHWRVLDLKLPPTLIMRMYGKDSGSLQLHTLHFSDTTNTAIPFAMQCGTTRPSKVVMADSFRLSRIEIDWSNVAHLEAAQADVRFDECVPILKLAPKLKRIIFNIYREPYPPKLLTSSSQVTLPNLCSLDLINAVSHHMYLFDVLTLSSLEKLSAPWIRDRASLVGLLRRSSCHLSHFHVGAVFSLASEVISFTRKMPYLKVISLHDITVDGFNQLSQLLAPPPTSGADREDLFFPPLSTLSLTGNLNSV